MKPRRSLVDGLSDTPPVDDQERQFVYGDKAEEVEDPSPRPITPVTTETTQNDVMPQFRGRVPLTTRCRPELASALKRASLQRQLSGAEPNRMQDILEVALEDWLRAHGYLN